MNEEVDRKLEIGKEVEHEIDPVLAGLVMLVDQDKALPGDVALFVSGRMIVGRLVDMTSGVQAFFQDHEYKPDPALKEAATAPYFLYLLDARILYANGNEISTPVVRVKLAHVDAWTIQPAQILFQPRA